MATEVSFEAFSLANTARDSKELSRLVVANADELELDFPEIADRYRTPSKAAKSMIRAWRNEQIHARLIKAEGSIRGMGTVILVV